MPSSNVAWQEATRELPDIAKNVITTRLASTTPALKSCQSSFLHLCRSFRSLLGGADDGSCVITMSATRLVWCATRTSASPAASHRHSLRQYRDLVFNLKKRSFSIQCCRQTGTLPRFLLCHGSMPLCQFLESRSIGSPGSEGRMRHIRLDKCSADIPQTSVQAGRRQNNYWKQQGQVVGELGVNLPNEARVAPRAMAQFSVGQGSTSTSTSTLCTKTYHMDFHLPGLIGRLCCCYFGTQLKGV